MLKILRNKRLQKIISVLLIINIIIGSFGLFTQQAEASDYEWISFESTGGNGIQSYRVYKDYIIQTGIHNTADDDSVHYVTKYYYMTKSQYALDDTFYCGSNASIPKEMLNMSILNEYVKGDIKTTEYKINRKEFIQVAAKLGVTGEFVYTNDGATVYLNNVFKIMQGNDTLDEYVWGYPAMMDAVNWSPATKNYLRGYYNFPYHLNNVAFNIKVQAVDTSGNVLVDNLMTAKKIYTEEVDYVLPEDKQTMVINGVTYNYKNSWKYDYTPVGLASTTTVDNNTGTTINKPAPDAEPKSTVTYKMIYEPEPISYTYTIQAYDDKGIYLGTMKKDTMVTVGVDNLIHYPIPSTTTFNNKSYNYQNRWTFYYNNSKGEQTASGTGDINLPVLMANKDDKAVFKVIYATTTVTPTPTPVLSSPPTPTPTPAPSVTPLPTIAPVVPPQPDSVTLSFTNVVTSGKLRADVRGSERFTASMGIPTTESLYGEVTAKEYLLGYRFEKKVGINYYKVKVTRNYILKWYTATPTSAGGGKLVTETIPITQEVTVPRAYGYWEIINLDCYKISNAVISNYALPNGSITIYPNYNYYTPPSISFSHSDNQDDHIIPPEEATNGITLADVVITPAPGQETHKPTVPTEDFTYYALKQTGYAKVKNDYLSFNGSTVISNQVVETETPDINIAAIPQCIKNTNANALYKPDNIIDATKVNGVLATLGTITYTKVAKIGSTMPDNPQYSIDGFEKVTIHTPVVCNPSITADNDKYVQLINPHSGCTQLVLDPDPTLSDFTVHISNIGYHTGKQGYYTRDFSKSIRNPDISYISLENALLKNQVKFPFDVYIDSGAANESSDDDFIKAGTWITIDRSSPRFYLPMTVNEGVYTVNFRTVAVNDEPYLNQTETFANTQLNNYVATETLKVEVSGRIYGLTVYDVTDYPMWQDVFRVKNSLDFKKDNSSYPDGSTLAAYSNGRSYTYTLGTNNQYGVDTGRDNKYTFPLVNGSHPQYRNIGILKTGYLVRFSLDTVGNMFSDACKISIKPNFYYVDKDGKNRIAVDLYYTEEINNKSRHLVKVGSALDQINLKEVMTGDLYLGIPEKELKQTAALRGMNYSEFTSKYSTMFGFSDIRLNWAFRTYINSSYLTKVKSYSSYSNITAHGISDGEILERMQRWYGQYYLPNEVHVVAKGYDVMDYADKHGIDYSESFWLKDGYIIVNFTIETIGEDGSRRLSYINYDNYRDNGNCSMWLLEGPVLSKSSYKGPTFNFYAGDMIIYYSGKRMTDDYDTGAIY